RATAAAAGRDRKRIESRRYPCLAGRQPIGTTAAPRVQWRGVDKSKAEENPAAVAFPPGALCSGGLRRSPHWPIRREAGQPRPERSAGRRRLIWASSPAKQALWRMADGRQARRRILTWR